MADVKPASPLDLLKQAQALVQSAINGLDLDTRAHDYTDAALDAIEWAIEAIISDAAEAEEADEPGTEAARRRGCTCRLYRAHPLDREPSAIRRDRNCPLHGIDPDRARDERRDA